MRRAHRLGRLRGRACRKASTRCCHVLCAGAWVHVLWQLLQHKTSTAFVARPLPSWHGHLTSVAEPHWWRWSGRSGAHSGPGSQGVDLLQGEGSTRAENERGGERCCLTHSVDIISPAHFLSS